MTPEEIKNLRKGNELTQKALAEKVGVCVNTVKQWESGRRHPSKQAIMIMKMIEKLKK